MNRRQRIIVSVTGIFIVLLILIGLTYGYFLTRITGNSNTNSISVTTADLELVYGDGTTALLTSSTPIEPGKFSSSKDFTVTNTGNALTEYAVTLEDFSVTYANDTVINGEEIKAGTVTKMEYPEDMKMEITCNAYKNYNESNQEDLGNCKWINGYLPIQNDILLTNSIDVDTTHVYELKLTYVDSGIDQSADMNKMIKGKIDIIDPKSTIDLTGSVASYQTGDYVEINSTPIISEIVDGKYKIIGVEPGSHTLNIKYKDASGNIMTRGSQPITIKKGEETNVSNNIITMTDDSRTVNVDITEVYDININNEINEYNPFEETTLAHKLLKNAYNVSSEEEKLGTAKFRNQPITIPGLESATFRVDKGAEETESAYSFIKTVKGDLSMYYTYGDSYEYSNEKYSIVNSDNSEIKVTQNFKELKGKYIVNYNGRTSSTPASATSLSNLYYVVDVDDTNIYYENSSYGLKDKEKYFTYGDSYIFNPETGYYRIINKDGSKLKSVSYKDNLDVLEGMYIDSFSGRADSTNTNYIINSTMLMKVSKNSTENEIKYYKVAPFYESQESSLTTTKDDFGTSYYYRGDVKNNYINFAGKCWRIVRIDGQGNIKLILEAKKLCQKITPSDKYNAFLSTRGYFGYTYDYPTNSKGEVATVKRYSDNYLNPSVGISISQVNLYKAFQNDLASYLSFLTPGNWCVDDNKYSNDGRLITGLELLDYKYSGTQLNSNFEIRRKNKEKSLMYCNDDLTQNYSDNTPMYVATLTADEVSFAGMLAGGLTNEKNYLHTDASFFGWSTLTIKERSYSSCFIYIINYGYITSANITEKPYFRPAINLISGITYAGGTGTQTDPYTVQ